MRRLDLASSRYYLNRHVQWLEFNRRVLEEARDIGNPLLERVKFLAITANNLDEFVEVRIASFLQRIEHGSKELSPDGLTVEQELERVLAAMRLLVRDQYQCWNEELLPALGKQSIRVLRMEELDAKALNAARTFYDQWLNPMLTPVTVDPSHPFPHVLNKALCIAFILRKRRGNRKSYFGVVTVPRALPRLLRVPSEEGAIHYVFLQEVLAHYAARLYRGYQIEALAPFRVTRNSNLYLQEEETRNLLETIDSQVALRRKGDAVRLEIEAGAHQEIVDRLVSTFELNDSLVFQVHGPVNLQRLFHLYDETPRPDLKYPPFTPRYARLGRDADSMFDLLRRQSVLMHHPYDSYDGVVRFLRTASRDPRVLSIKQTLYRTNAGSPIAQALLEAAGKKEVTVVVELKASFDEASNIRWARTFQNAGVQVFHGLVALKTHAKLALIVRNDPDGKIRRYAHLGTGNYNPSTARYYTDFSLLTSDEEFTCAVHNIFNYLTAYSEQPSYTPFLVAPRDLAKSCMQLVDRETRHARRGRPARIIAKVNALIDPPLIQALYRASRSGVDIDLIVRGQCTLIPGLRGVSSRIRVRSIVGRFLEHSRIFYFENAGSPEVYLGSADWMPRNLYERVEVLFPLKQPEHLERICSEILPAYLADTRKARLLQPNGTYAVPRAARNGHGFSVQEHLIRLAAAGEPRGTASVHLPTEDSESEAKTATQEVEEPVNHDTSNAAI